MAGGDLEDCDISSQNSNIAKLRSLVRTYIDRHHYDSALFWADKVVSLNKAEPQDIYWYAQTLYLTAQYHRAAHLIKTHKLDKRFPAGRYLAAKCHYECREYPEAMEILDQSESSILGFKTTLLKSPEEGAAGIPTDKIESSINLLRGKVYEAMENRNLAAECFREALVCDVFCFEAFESLVSHHMMTSQEEKTLLDTLPFDKQCTESETQLLQFLYENKLKKYSRPSMTELPSNLRLLSTNLDIVVTLAERHYYNCDFREAYKIASQVLKRDPYNCQCLPLYVAVLVELRKSNELFALAHKLVDIYPNKAMSWFATGCYYFLVGKNDPARRYLSKATTVDRVFGPAWLAFGHSFAVENEHDQAMAAYFTASQLMKGCHLPVLYIGLEYGLTNNAKLAERFFTQALSIANEDPFVLHEMGVVAFKNQDYVQAETYFSSGLQKIETVCHEVLVDKWEPLLNNLGHVCRKLKKYEQALEYHQQALVLLPQNPATLSAMGYVYSLMGDCFQAVHYFHKKMSIPGVVEFDFEIPEAGIQDGAVTLLKTLRPDWNQEDIVFKTYTDGITNKLIGCRHKDDKVYKDSLLVRVYGQGTDKIIDREIEMFSMYVLHAAGCSKALYGKFRNGLTYGFVPGECLDADTTRDPHIGSLVAKEMVQLGAVDPGQYSQGITSPALARLANRDPVVFTKTRSMLNQAPETFPDAEKTEKLKRTIPSYDKLHKELDMLEDVLSKLDSPVVFCHNDILLKNVVHNKEEERCYFIDYEYAGFNYQAFDIGNHFCEWAGIDEVDYDRYPDKETQLVWLRSFLTAYKTQQDKGAPEPSDKELQVLYVQANKFALAAHFFWGIWALIQARYSTIDFDYLEYSKIRLDEYFRRKGEFMSLKLPD